MNFVSDFADQAVMLPLAVLILTGLAMFGWWRGALAWAAAVGGTFGLILVLKAGFFLLTADFGSDYRVSPSGHVAAACMVYGGLAVLMLKGSVPAGLIAAVPVVATVVIGYTRLSLGVHTPAEVVMGAVVGLSGVAALGLMAGPRPRIPAWPLAAATGLTVLALHGMHLPAEEAIQVASLSW